MVENKRKFTLDLLWPWMIVGNQLINTFSDCFYLQEVLVNKI